MYLNCHSYYSFKYGTMSPEELLREAKRKGISCIALTDINSTSGILDFFRLAKNHEIKPVAGIDFRNGVEQKFIGIAKNRDGFYELNKFLSHHLHTGEKFADRAPEFENSFVIYPFDAFPSLRGTKQSAVLFVTRLCGGQEIASGDPRNDAQCYTV